MTSRKKTKLSRPRERQKTDKSLRKERVEADKQLTDRIEETETRTDDAVGAVREDSGQRRRIDKALKDERRERAETVEKSLGNERATTDKHLKGERRAADEIAARAQAEESAEAAALDQTREALTKRDEFMDIVGHDLKQPLLAVATAADSLLADDWLVRADPDVRERMTTICEEVRHALRRLGDLQERVAVWQSPGLDEPR